MAKSIAASAACASLLGKAAAFAPGTAGDVSLRGGWISGTSDSGATSAPQQHSSASATTAFAAVAAVAAGAAFSRRSRRSSEQSVVVCRAETTAQPSPVEGMIGAPSEAERFLIGGDNIYDPLGIAEKCPQFLPWFREAELKHGRICMMAWVGMVVPDFVRIPGPDYCYATASTLTAHNACISTDVLDRGAPDRHGPLFQVLIFVGILEMTTTYPKWLKTAQGGQAPEVTVESAGDYALGLNFLPKDEQAATEMRLKELKNGRLAMLAFSGAIVQAMVSNQGFPWLFSDAATPASAMGKEARTGFGSSVGPAASPMARALGRTTVRAEGEGGYKMSKAVPFLPVSPALEGYVGEEDGFDPIGMSLAWDIRWLREAELKHARVTMLATLGWITTDLGFRVPGEPFQVSTLEAHDAMVKFGSMPQMLVWIGYAELFGFLAIINMMEEKTDRKPGDFGLRFLYPKDEKGQYDMQMKELRNGRLAMLAFSGIATAGAFSGKPWPFFGTDIFAEGPRAARAASCKATFCGSSKGASGKTTAVASRAEASRSLPFLPKPQNLSGFVGEEQEFDPLGFSDTFDMKWLREAELKHGRVCMLATVGFAAQQYIAFPGMKLTENALNAVYTETNGLATLIFLAGYIESVTYDGKITMLDMFEGKPDKVPGDFNFGAGFLKGKSDKDVYDIKLKELNNGRLAMLAFGGMVHHNLVVNGPLFPMFPDGWKGPQGTWQVESLAGGLVDLTYNSPVSGMPL